MFYAERVPRWLVIKAQGAPGHGAKLYDGSAMENLMKSVETIRRFRAAQFDMLKSGEKAEGEVVSVNFAFLKAGTPTPTVSFAQYYCYSNPVGGKKILLILIVILCFF